MSQPAKGKGKGKAKATQPEPEPEKAPSPVGPEDAGDTQEGEAADDAAVEVPSDAETEAPPAAEVEVAEDAFPKPPFTVAQFPDPYPGMEKFLVDWREPYPSKSHYLTRKEYNGTYTCAICRSRVSGNSNTTNNIKRHLTSSTRPRTTLWWLL